MDGLLKLAAAGGVTIGALACFGGAIKWFIAMLPIIGFGAAIAGALAWFIWAIGT